MAVPAVGSAPAPVCKAWEVSTYNPNDNCKFKGKNPYITRSESCEVPDGFEPLGITMVQSGMTSVDYVYAVRKCTSW